MNTIVNLGLIAAWKTIGRQAVQLAKQAAAAAPPATLPAWWHPERGWHTDPAVPPLGYGQEPWVFCKRAEEGHLSDVVRPLMQAWHLAPAAFSKAYGGPTPIAATIAGGLLGAGLGYGGGALAEQLAPEGTLEKGRLRKTTAFLGGLLGAVPGLATGGVGMSMAPQGENAWKAWGQPNVFFGKESIDRHQALAWAAEDLAEELPGPMSKQWTKMADQTGALFVPAIPVDLFGRTIWDDVNTPLAIRGATTGLLDAADQAKGGGGWVSPYDVARVLVGAGVGFGTGRLIGKALGVLAGLTPETQKDLQRTGMWAGVLQSVVPRAFGM